MLGPGNDGAAREALTAWPGSLQVGGGIKDTNAKSWIEAGAERVYSRVFAIIQMLASLTLRSRSS